MKINIGGTGLVRRSDYLRLVRVKKRRRYKSKPKSRGKSLKKRGLSKVEHFHRQKPKISRTILSKVDDKEIIYGARALNKRFPPFLDRHTVDFDIYSTHPRKDARETEKALDKAFGGDHFYVKPAIHPGTFKVKAHANEETYADYTKPKERIPYDRIGGKKYVKLSFVKTRIRKTLRDPESKYRWDRDKDSLNRILIYEKSRGR